MERGGDSSLGEEIGCFEENPEAWDRVQRRNPGNSIRKCAQWLCVEPALSEGLSVILCTRGEELMEEESVLFSPL